MRFSFFNTMHHETGQRSLEDVVGIMAKQLRALGHEAALDPRNERIDTAFMLVEPDAVNVLVEGFNAAWVEVMGRFREAGARMLIVATEEPTPKGFNWGRDPQMVRRQEIFPRAAALTEGILHLVPGRHVTEWYGRHAPAAQAELGYAPDLMRPTGPEPDHEFGFYGSMTDRREKILRRLAAMTGKEKAVKIVGDFRSQAERDREMQRAKVILQIRKFDEMGLVSSSRCNTALMLGRPVVAEPHELSAPWDEVVDFAPTMDAFYARALLAARLWRETWAAQVAKFKAKMTPEFCVGEPLRRIGVLREPPPMPSATAAPSLEAIAAARARRRRLMYG